MSSSDRRSRFAFERFIGTVVVPQIDRFRSSGVNPPRCSKKGRLNGLLWKRQTLKAAAFCVLYTGICRPLRFPVPCLSLRRRCLMFLLWIPRTRKTKRGKCQGSFVLRFFKFSQTNGNHSVFRLKRIIPLEISSFRRVPRIIQFVCFAILRFKDLLGLFFIFRDNTYRDIVFLSRLFFRKIAFLFVQF